MAAKPDELALSRWRLVLGRFAESSLGGCLGSGSYAAMDRVLDYLYGREYADRGVRRPSTGREGGSGASVFAIPDWLIQVRELFRVLSVRVRSPENSQ